MAKKYVVSLRWEIEEDEDGSVAGYEDLEEFLNQNTPEFDDYTIEDVPGD